MKKLTIICFLLMTTCLYSQTNTLSEARRLLQLQKNELIIAKEENKKLASALNDSFVKITQGEVHLMQVQTTADALRQWGIDQQNESMTNFNQMMIEKKEKEKAIKKYHFSKLLNSITACILGLVLGLNLMKFVPPVYSYYAFALPLLGAIFGFILVWFLL